MRLSISILLSFLIVGPTFAQNPGCTPATASGVLDAANVRAGVFNNGALHWSGGSNIYEVPKGSGQTATFHASLLMSGLVAGERRVTGSLYQQFEYYPGPYREISADTTACNPYDRMYSVYHDDLERGVITPDIADWPHDLGAPVVDGDGNPDNYDPEAGDRPEILGDQSIWWLMNDGAGVHDFYETAPLGIEVRGTAFVWDLLAPAGNTTFYRYRVRNAAAQAITDTYIGLFMDVDLGVAFEDRTGSDSTLALAYFYNSDTYEFRGETIDNENRPEAIGYTFLRGPHPQIASNASECRVDETSRLTTTSNVWLFKGGSHELSGEPHDAESAWNLMRGRARDGSPIRKGWFWWEGSENEPITTWTFPGNPITESFWSEYNLDRQGNRLGPSDKRSMMGMGPFCLNPGDEEEFVLAIVWSQGADHKDSIRQLKEDVALIRNGEGAWVGSQPVVRDPELPPPTPNYPLGANGIYPNPASKTATLDYSLPQPMHVRLEVFDVLGRRVFDGADGMRDAGEYTAQFDVTDWPAGVYTARLQLDRITATRTFVVVK